MIQRTLAVALIALFAMSSSPALADGLLYQLPADGSWAKFDMKLEMSRGDETRTMDGSLRMAVVGTATEDGQTARWIEFDFRMKEGEREEKVIAKVLIPQKHLKKGATPMENYIRGWLQQREGRDPEELDKNDLGPMPAFLAGPLKEAKKLPKETVNTKPLGELNCEGVSGRTSYVERPGRDGRPDSEALIVYHDIRLHKKAPFGVVRAKMQYKAKRGDKVRDRGVMTLTLIATGTDAETALPDSN